MEVNNLNVTLTSKRSVLVFRDILFLFTFHDYLLQQSQTVVVNLNITYRTCAKAEYFLLK